MIVIEETPLCHDCSAEFDLKAGLSNDAIKAGSAIPNSTVSARRFQ
jgi:hypothetical protein